MELVDADDDDLGLDYDVETKQSKDNEKKKRFQTELVNNFHYPEMDDQLLQDFDSYMKWHKDHPGTTTPRKQRFVSLFIFLTFFPSRGKIAALIDAGELRVVENNPDLVYRQSKAGRGQRSVPAEFKSQEMGKDAEFSVVTAKAHSHEHRLRLKESLDFEDPWWNKSVRDQVFVHHTNDFHEEEGSWEIDSTVSDLTQHLTSGSKAEQRESQRRARAEQLALEGSWGKKPRATRTVWEDPTEFSKYTIDGVEALAGFTAEALERNLEIALKEYEASESGQSLIKGAGLSVKDAELHQRISDYREILGGLDATEKMSEEFVKYSVKMRKRVEGGGSLFDGKTGDFLDACMKSNPTKVLPMLMFRANPNTRTEDDEPVFVMTMKKIIFSDASKGSEQERDTKERRNCLKIMEALVQYGADIDCLVTEAKLSPLMIVASVGHTELVTWLLDKGADPNIACPFNGCTAIMLASKYGHPRTIAEIVRKQGALNAKDVSPYPCFLLSPFVVTTIGSQKEGNSALHYAALFGQTRTAKFLLRIGASRFQRNQVSLPLFSIPSSCLSSDLSLLSSVSRGRLARERLRWLPRAATSSLRRSSLGSVLQTSCLLPP
jgi:ankyrin repeat protein